MLRLTVLLALAARAAAMEFDCTTLVPVGRTASERQKDNPFIMNIDTSKLYSAGDVVTVKVTSYRQHFNKFIIQARQPLVDVPLGEFRLDGDNMVTRLAKCDNEGNTLTNRGHQAISQVTAEWVVPSGLTNVQNIEFDIAVVSERRFWIFNSQMISLETQKPSSHPTAEEERQHHKEHTPSDDVVQSPQPKQEDQGTGEDPNEPEKREQQERQEAERRDHIHDAQTEQELSIQQEERLRQQIEDEDQNSEGDWQKKEKSTDGIMKRRCARRRWNMRSVRPEKIKREWSAFSLRYVIKKSMTVRL